MNLSYQIFSFQLKFNQLVFFDVYPAFLFRSLLGKELRRMSCVFSGRECNECGLKDKCVYSCIFETPVSKDNDFLKGRNKASHPFLFFIPTNVSKPVLMLTIELTLLGDVSELFPYFYYALREAGNKGILRERISYKIEDVICEGKSLFSKDGNIKTDFELKEWKIIKTHTAYRYNLKLKFLTPVRLQSERRLVKHPSLENILRAAWNRARILTALYGQGYEEIERLDWSVYEQVKSISYWKSLSRYSARQKRIVKLGGVMGHLEFEGEISDFCISLLKVVELFHIGKNTALGLGKILVEKID